jgi:hypothetical protein
VLGDIAYPQNRNPAKPTESGFQPPSRLEAAAQPADEQQAIAIIRRSCSDSLLTASQMD